MPAVVIYLASNRTLLGSQIYPPFHLITVPWYDSLYNSACCAPKQIRALISAGGNEQIEGHWGHHMVHPRSSFNAAVCRKALYCPHRETASQHAISHVTQCYQTILQHFREYTDCRAGTILLLETVCFVLQ